MNIKILLLIFLNILFIKADIQLLKQDKSSKLSDDLLKRRLLKRYNNENFLDELNSPPDSSSITNIEENSKIKYYLNDLNLDDLSQEITDNKKSMESINNKNQLEFIEHPEDVLITGKLPVLVQCLVKNSIQTYLECNNKIREDAKKNVTKKGDVKYESVTLMIKRKDVEISSNGEIINRKLVCKCVAYSIDNEKLTSNKAVVKTAYIEEEFQSEPMDEMSYEGETVEMRCDPPKGEPTPNVYWLKDNKEIDTHSDSSRFKLSNDYSLLILASKKSDSGNYVCVASNLIDKRISKPARLTLLDPSKRYVWSEWSDWSECSSKCGPGIIKRTRTCQTTNKMAQIQNVSISMCGNGASFEDQPCQIVPCSNELPQWSEWSPWSTCTNDCKQFRRRFCENESVNSKQNSFDLIQSFSLDKPNSIDSKVKTCIGDKIMVRLCNNSKLCKEKSLSFISSNNDENNNINTKHYPVHHRHFNSQSREDLQFNHELDLAQATPVNINYTPKQPNSNIIYNLPSQIKPEAETKLDQTFLKIGIGLSASILLASLFILLIILTFILKRNKTRKNRSELNLYYTCEKQMPVDDECSIFKFSKGSSSTTASSSSSTGASALTSSISSAFRPTKSMRQKQNEMPVIHVDSLNPRMHCDTNNRIYHGTNIEQQLLLGNIQQQYQLVQSNNNASFLINTQNYLNLPSPTNQINSAFRTINQNGSSSLSSTGSSNKNTTTTTVTSKSINLSTSPSSNIYYAAPIQNNDIVQMGISLDESNYNYNDLILKHNSEKKMMRKIQEQNSDYLNYQSFSYHQQIDHLQQIKNQQDEELAYDIAETLNSTIDYKQTQAIPLNNMDLTDICVGQVNSQGARLTLDCGISLLVPEGAISSDQKLFMYLGICRNESFKPKLNDKNTFLSEIIQIGPSNLTLLKPVVLTIDHCAENINQDWSVNLFTAYNSYERAPEWNEDQNLTSDNNTNLNMFLNSTEKSFILVTEKLGRYCLTGESKNFNNCKKQPSASKYYRLITFCSSSITNNDFNLRIYCIDNLLVALQEVLRDEKKIGGTLLESSEPFLITHSNMNDSISLCIDDLNKNVFNCKYNVNCQEIPLSHIWNGRNHLLHCSFTLEKNTDLTYDQEFSCKLRANRSNKEQLVTIRINYDLKNLLANNKDNVSSEINLDIGLRNWNFSTINSYLDSWSNLINPKNLIRSYFKIDKTLKKQISTILDDSYINEKNWRALAQKLEIHRNLHYFASKASPTEMLLLYFEAISDLKCHDLIRLNNDLIKAKHTTSLDQFSSPQERLFREIFLNYIL